MDLNEKIIKTTEDIERLQEKLKNKKKYYFRMRAYKKVSGTKVYGVYSSKKTVKITK